MGRIFIKTKCLVNLPYSLILAASAEKCTFFPKPRRRRPHYGVAKPRAPQKDAPSPDPASLVS